MVQPFPTYWEIFLKRWETVSEHWDTAPQYLGNCSPMLGSGLPIIGRLFANAWDAASPKLRLRGRVSLKDASRFDTRVSACDSVVAAKPSDTIPR